MVLVWENFLRLSKSIVNQKSVYAFEAPTMQAFRVVSKPFGSLFQDVAPIRILPTLVELA
jgi:hypothetical protein